MRRKNSEFCGKTCLVAGGAGFIGSHLCRRLLCMGARVFCVDTLITGKKSNIKDLFSNSSFSFAKEDIADATFVGKLKKKGINPDYIFHLASPASPVKYQRYPLETLLVNTQGTYNLLRIAKRFKSRFLFASTSEVYGDPKVHPQKETYFGNVNPVGPRACYDESKRCGESFVSVFFSKFHQDVRIVRIFNTYGPFMDKKDGRVISSFIVQALLNEPITIFGDGSQTRSFCFVSDMVEGIILAMVKGKSGEVYNLGNPEEKKILEVAELIKKMIKTNSKIVFLPARREDPRQRRPDITKAKRHLGWEPTVSFEEGIKKTIAYFKDIL